MECTPNKKRHLNESFNSKESGTDISKWCCSYILGAEQTQKKHLSEAQLNLENYDDDLKHEPVVFRKTSKYEAVEDKTKESPFYNKGLLALQNILIPLQIQKGKKVVLMIPGLRSNI